MLLFAGIDPGTNGAIAVVTNNRTRPYAVLPLENPPRLDSWKTLNQLARAGQLRVVLEKINPAIYGANKSACAKLFAGYSVLDAYLTILADRQDCLYQTATAAKWHRYLGIFPRGREETNSQWKQRLACEARKHFPRFRITLQTADALLLALYCRQVFLRKR